MFSIQKQNQDFQKVNQDQQLNLQGYQQQTQVPVQNNFQQINGFGENFGNSAHQRQDAPAPVKNGVQGLELFTDIEWAQLYKQCKTRNFMQVIAQESSFCQSFDSNERQKQFVQYLSKQLICCSLYFEHQQEEKQQFLFFPLIVSDMGYQFEPVLVFDNCLDANGQNITKIVLGYRFQQQDIQMQTTLSDLVLHNKAQPYMEVFYQDHEGNVQGIYAPMFNFQQNRKTLDYYLAFSENMTEMIYNQEILVYQSLFFLVKQNKWDMNLNSIDPNSVQLLQRIVANHPSGQFQREQIEAQRQRILQKDFGGLHLDDAMNQNEKQGGFIGLTAEPIHDVQYQPWYMTRPINVQAWVGFGYYPNDPQVNLTTLTIKILYDGEWKDFFPILNLKDLKNYQLVFNSILEVEVAANVSLMQELSKGIQIATYDTQFSLIKLNIESTKQQIANQVTLQQCNIPEYLTQYGIQLQNQRHKALNEYKISDTASINLDSCEIYNELNSLRSGSKIADTQFFNIVEMSDGAQFFVVQDRQTSFLIVDQLERVSVIVAFRIKSPYKWDRNNADTIFKIENAVICVTGITRERYSICSFNNARILSCSNNQHVLKLTDTQNQLMLLESDINLQRRIAIVYQLVTMTTKAEKGANFNEEDQYFDKGNSITLDPNILNYNYDKVGDLYLNNCIDEEEYAKVQQVLKTQIQCIPKACDVRNIQDIRIHYKVIKIGETKTYTFFGLDPILHKCQLKQFEGDQILSQIDAEICIGFIMRNTFSQFDLDGSEHVAYGTEEIVKFYPAICLKKGKQTMFISLKKLSTMQFPVNCSVYTLDIDDIPHIIQLQDKSMYSFGQYTKDILFPFFDMYPKHQRNLAQHIRDWILSDSYAQVFQSSLKEVGRVSTSNFNKLDMGQFQCMCSQNKLNQHLLVKHVRGCCDGSNCTQHKISFVNEQLLFEKCNNCGFIIFNKQHNCTNPQNISVISTQINLQQQILVMKCLQCAEFFSCKSDAEHDSHLCKGNNYVMYSFDVSSVRQQIETEIMNSQAKVTLQPQQQVPQTVGLKENQKQTVQSIIDNMATNELKSMKRKVGAPIIYDGQQSLQQQQTLNQQLLIMFKHDAETISKCKEILQLKCDQILDASITGTETESYIYRRPFQDIIIVRPKIMCQQTVICRMVDNATTAQKAHLSVGYTFNYDKLVQQGQQTLADCKFGQECVSLIVAFEEYENNPINVNNPEVEQRMLIVGLNQLSIPMSKQSHEIDIMDRCELLVNSSTFVDLRSCLCAISGQDAYSTDFNLYNSLILIPASRKFDDLEKMNVKTYYLSDELNTNCFSQSKNMNSEIKVKCSCGKGASFEASAFMRHVEDCKDQKKVHYPTLLQQFSGSNQYLMTKDKLDIGTTRILCDRCQLLFNDFKEYQSHLISGKLLQKYNTDLQIANDQTANKIVKHEKGGAKHRVVFIPFHEIDMNRRQFKDIKEAQLQTIADVESGCNISMDQVKKLAHDDFMGNNVMMFPFPVFSKHEKVKEVI